MGEPEVSAEEAAAAAAEVERKVALCRSVGEECVTESELHGLLSKKAEFRAYDGFEPSGRMHIAQGIFKALNVNKLTSCGGTFVLWVADWFGLMNDKMGGDLDKIKVVGQYFIEIWKGAGMDLSRVEFRWASDSIISDAEAYWHQMLDISKRFTLARVKKCCQIMGRLENNLTAAQIMYPLMQCADIFYLKTDICQLGVDQRKVNMLAREYCDAIGRKLKPVILSHHMLYGLAQGQAKMSKSNPDSAIFMEDSVEEVERKLSIAYCPTKPADAAAESSAGGESMSLVVDELKNPVLDYVQHIVMSQPGAVFQAGGHSFETFEQVKTAFLEGTLSEADLKKAVADAVNVLMQPVRDHFANDPTAKEVLSKVKQYKREEVKPPVRLKRSVKLAVPGEVAVVFAPLAGDPKLSLGLLLATKAALARAKQVEGARRTVLYLSDLVSEATNAFGGDKKLKATDCIKAFYNLFVTALRAVDGLDESVEVVWQSQTMLADPSDYWLSVIDVGRHFQLQEVEKAHRLCETQAGAIIGALMHVGDVLSLAPHTVVPVQQENLGLHNLAVNYINACSSQQDAIAPPAVLGVEEVSTIMSAENAANVVDLLVLDNLKAEVKKKLKQAFCEPGNAEYNPVLVLAEELAFRKGLKLTVALQAGGDREYDSAQALRADYSSEAVHPGDLKKAVGPLVDTVYHSIEAAIKSSADKDAKLVLNFIKRQSKK